MIGHVTRGSSNKRNWSAVVLKTVIKFETENVLEKTYCQTGVNR